MPRNLVCRRRHPLIEVRTSGEREMALAPRWPRPDPRRCCRCSPPTAASALTSPSRSETLPMPTSPILSVQLYPRERRPPESQLDPARAVGSRPWRRSSADGGPPGYPRPPRRPGLKALSSADVLALRGHARPSRLGDRRRPRPRDRDPDRPRFAPALPPHRRRGLACGRRRVGRMAGAPGREHPASPSTTTPGRCSRSPTAACRSTTCSRTGAEGGPGWQADLAWLVRGGDDPLARWSATPTG